MEIKPQPQQINVELGEKESEGIYSNLAFITHSPSEVIIDFARLLPGVPRSKVYARVIMTPQHAKLLLQTLDENLKKYETQFGQIKIFGKEEKGIGFKTVEPSATPVVRTDQPV
jgi:hypothetical protein